MKNNYLDLLSELENEHANSRALSLNSKTLIVDGLNTFIRSFSVDPSCNDNGVHVGGITGFLKSVGYAIKVFNPTRVVIVFDGKGGSQRRRKLYPDYKHKRKASTRYNRSIHISSQEDEQQSMKMQISRLLQYLETLPVSIFCIDNIEADDVISFIAKNPLDNEVNNYYIMSTDKDFYQLINDNITVWSPTKKKMYDVNAILDEYGIHPNNFIMYRILDGDVSDNISGVKGFALKTVQKSFPFLKEELESNIDSLINNSTDKKGKCFESLLNSKDILERNFKLMQLKNVDISGNAKLKITNNIRENSPTLNQWGFKTFILEDQINSAFPNLDGWLKTCFETLNTYSLNYAKH